MRREGLAWHGAGVGWSAGVQYLVSEGYGGVEDLRLSACMSRYGVYRYLY
jgi:hypothetical protein